MTEPNFHKIVEAYIEMYGGDQDVTNTTDYLKYYYGNNAEKIERDAVATRHNGVRQPSYKRAYNTTTMVPGQNSSEYYSTRPDPLKNIHFTNGRSYARYGNYDNSIYINPNGHEGWKAEDVVNHELGHALNAQGIMHPTNRSDADAADDEGIGYEIANDDELGSFLGGVRRQVYKKTGGRVDTANPADFRKVQRNPAKYGVSPYEQQGFRDLNNLQRYRGNSDSDSEGKFDPKAERRDELNRRLNDPAYMGQFVKNGSSGNNETSATA